MRTWCDLRADGVEVPSRGANWAHWMQPDIVRGARRQKWAISRRSERARADMTWLVPMRPSSVLLFVPGVIFLVMAACDSSRPGPGSSHQPGDGDTGDGDGMTPGDGDGNGDGDGDSDVVDPLDDNRYTDPSADTTPRPSPDFGPHVYIFDSTLPHSEMQSQLDTVFDEQESAQMGTGRYAFLLHPGQYDLDINVGYYTEVHGLGDSPDDVIVTGAVRAEADWFGGNSTHNFWRSVANMQVVPTVDAGFNRWAVSQAAPFRRMHIMGNMVLDDGGWASGGFLADSIIEGSVSSGSQQQWFSRNSAIGSWNGGVWNMYFLGVEMPPIGSWPPYTYVSETPRLREKPFLFVNSVGNYYVHVPALKETSRGVSWQSGRTEGRSIAIEEFYIAYPDEDDAETINTALSQGMNLLLTPGVYHLDSSIRVQNAGTVVLGLGLPTLLAETGNVLIEVADVDGVKIAGLTIDAGETISPTLMIVGPVGSDASHSQNPTSIHDVFCRVGGGFPGSSLGCMEINSHHVIGDHFWLWRADHGNGVGWAQNLSKNGLIVRGDDVSIYGLFVEHFHEYQTIWEGERGLVHFYQCEMPYDPPSQQAWQHDGVNGYAGYKVADSVMNHEAWGLGVYAVFHDAPVAATQAIEVPETPGVRMYHMVTRSLGGNGGEITSVINGVGATADNDNIGAELAQYPP
jgi:hypothetical protein